MDPSTDSLEVLLIDHHQMVREALARTIESAPGLHLAGHCGSTSEGIALLSKAAGRTVVLLESNVGQQKALGFIDEARRAGFPGPILILTAGITSQEAMHLVQAGAAGIIHKRRSTSELFDAIRRVAEGRAWLEEEYLTSLLRSVDRTRVSHRPRLTSRDHIMLQHIVDGLSNREIAVHLNISEGAVKASLRQLFDKAGVRTRSQLVRVALEQYKDEL